MGRGLPAVEMASPVLDTSFLAYLREMGASETIARGETSSLISRLRAQIAGIQPVYADKMREGLQGIGDEFENRGLLRSGRRLTEQSRYQRDVTREKLGAENDINDRIQGASTSLAATIAAGRRGRAEAELMARQRSAIDNAEAGL